jgi:serine/threonine-protein kinase
MVAAGGHEIEVVNEALGFRATRTVQVPPGRVAPLRVELPRGSVSLNAVPWAEVWIDGERLGETPMANVAVPIGPHEVVFRNPQFGERRHVVTVTTGAPARVSVDLRK